MLSLTADMEARRVQRDKETEDLVRKKFEKAEEEKKRKMEAFQSQKPTCERDSQYHASADKAVLDKKKQADEEKAKKLQAYSQISEHKTPEGATVRTATTTMKSEGKRSWASGFSCCGRVGDVLV